MAVKIEERGDGSYSFLLWVPDKDGTRKRKRFTVKAKSRREAEKEYTRIKNDLNRGTYVEATKLTVAEHVMRWLQDYAAPKVGAKTYEDYETVVQRHILPALGSVPLEKLRSLDIQRFYREKQATLSASRVRLIHVVLHQALDKAIKGRLLQWNPMEGVEPPKPPRHRTRDVYNADQVNVLLEQSRTSVAHIAVVLAVHTGMRLGEICALQWTDVDLEAGTIYVHQSLSHTKREGLRFKLTKSEDSRLIRLPSAAIPELRRHKAEQAERRLLLGDFWQDHGLVWPRDDGAPRNPDQASRTCREFIRRTGLPPIRFHDVRHTHATLLGHAKVSSKVVQQRMGHKTHAITMDLYTHVFAEAHDEAAEAMDRILRKA